PILGDRSTHGSRSLGADAAPVPQVGTVGKSRLARNGRPMSSCPRGGLECEPANRRRHQAMSKVIVSEFLTVDGVMQSPGYTDEDASGGFEHGGWQLPLLDDVLMEAVMGVIGKARGRLLGRRTYDIVGAWWPNQPADDPIAPTFNEMPKYVASTTLSEPLPWEN